LRCIIANSAGLLDLFNAGRVLRKDLGQTALTLQPTTTTTTCAQGRAHALASAHPRAVLIASRRRLSCALAAFALSVVCHEVRCSPAPLRFRPPALLRRAAPRRIF